MGFKEFLADQKARLTNVKDVFVSIAKGQGTTANVKNQTVKKALEGATKNPLTVAGTALAGASVAFAGKKIVQGVVAKQAAKKAAVSTGSVLKQGGTGGTVAGKTIAKVSPKGKIPTMVEKLNSAAGVVGAAKSILGNRSQPTTVNPSLSGNPVLSATNGTPISESLIYEQTGAIPSTVIGETVMSGQSNLGSIVSQVGGQSFSVSKSSHRAYGTRKKRNSHKKTKTKTKRNSRSKSRKTKKYGTAKQYKRKGGLKVKYTKNGQPYIILKSGKARFVKGRRKK